MHIPDEVISSLFCAEHPDEPQSVCNGAIIGLANPAEPARPYVRALYTLLLNERAFTDIVLAIETAASHLDAPPEQATTWRRLVDTLRYVGTATKQKCTALEGTPESLPPAGSTMPSPSSPFSPGTPPMLQ